MSSIEEAPGVRCELPAHRHAVVKEFQVRNICGRNMLKLSVVSWGAQRSVHSGNLRLDVNHTPGWRPCVQKVLSALKHHGRTRT